MKLFKQEPVYIIRFQIIKQGEETKYINLCECTMSEAEEYVKNVIQTQNVSPFEQGRKVMVNIRESKDGKNGKSKNISFRGLSVARVYDLLVKNIGHRF